MLRLTVHALQLEVNSGNKTCSPINKVLNYTSAREISSKPYARDRLF